jgi:hypothetical protein
MHSRPLREQAIVSTRTVRRLIKFFTIVLIFLLTLLAYSVTKSFTTNKSKSTYEFNSFSKLEQFKQKDELDGRNKQLKHIQECSDLYMKIRRNPHIYKPPLRSPPEDMLESFQMNRKMPIVKYEYEDNSFNDSDGKTIGKIPVITKKDLENIELRHDDFENLNHGPKVLQSELKDYKHQIKGAEIAVLGSDDPWIETIVSTLGAKKVHTLEYTRRNYEDDKFKWWHIHDFLDMALDKNYVNKIDFAVTYSTIQHAGLGRYGDALSPDGDLESMKLINCKFSILIRIIYF